MSQLVFGEEESAGGVLGGGDRGGWEKVRGRIQGRVNYVRTEKKVVGCWLAKEEGCERVRI